MNQIMYNLFTTDDEWGIFDAAAAHYLAKARRGGITVTYCTKENVLNRLSSFLDALRFAEANGNHLPIFRSILVSARLTDCKVERLLEPFDQNIGNISCAMIGKSGDRELVASVLSQFMGKYDRDDMVFTVMETLDHVVRSTSKKSGFGRMLSMNENTTPSCLQWIDETHAHIITCPDVRVFFSSNEDTNLIQDFKL